MPDLGRPVQYETERGKLVPWRGGKFGWRVPVLGCLAVCGVAAAQVFPPAPVAELSASITVDQVPGSAQTTLHQVQAYLADQRWAEALDALLRVVDEHGPRLVEASPRQWRSLRDHSHRLIAGLPEAGLREYRQRVDVQARQWYASGAAQRDAALLRRVVDWAYCSSFGDDALNTLAELALEEGQYGLARGYWEQLLTPDDAAAAGLHWPRTAGGEENAAVLALPDVQARLVMVSVLEGDLPRAQRELASFQERYPQAAGRLGGREGVYAALLEGLLAQRRQWPSPARSEQWTTFAGSPQRWQVVAEAADPAAVVWRHELPAAPRPDLATMRNLLRVQLGVAEDQQTPLSYHPIRYRDLVLVPTQEQVLAIRLEDGSLAWRRESPLARRDSGRRRPTLGVPRFTATRYGNRMFVRLGNPATGWAGAERREEPRGYLLCLDLEAEGRLVWPPLESEEGWAFEGAPVCDGRDFYTVMRRSGGGTRPQVHVAAFDATTARLRWRRLVASAEAPARDAADEVTHTLLCLHGGTLYVNTNLGAVAAMHTSDGHIRWLYAYPRAKGGAQGGNHFLRDPNPCVYYGGKVFAAPADAAEVFALEAISGRLLWQTPPLEDAVHLLGATPRHLIASGRRLYWIDAQTGRVAHVFPASGARLGYGRGVLAGEVIFFPGRDRIFVLPQEPPPGVWTPPPYRQPIRLADRDARHVPSGNLLIFDQYVLICTHDELIALHPFAREVIRPAGPMPQAPPREVSLRP